MSLFRTEEPWQIMAARWCVINSAQGFTENELKVYIREYCSVEEVQANQFFEEEIRTVPGRNIIRNMSNGRWIPPLSLVAKVTDYDELKEARINSSRAFYLALLANVIAGSSFYLTYFEII